MTKLTMKASILLWMSLLGTSAFAQIPAPVPMPIPPVQMEQASQVGAPPAEVVCQNARTIAYANVIQRCNPPDRPNENIVPVIVNEISKVNQVSAEVSTCQYQIYFQCTKP